MKPEDLSADLPKHILGLTAYDIRSLLEHFSESSAFAKSFKDQLNTYLLDPFYMHDIHSML